jgi:hypothetical protein
MIRVGGVRGMFVGMGSAVRSMGGAVLVMRIARLDASRRLESVSRCSW